MFVLGGSYTLSRRQVKGQTPGLEMHSLRLDIALVSVEYKGSRLMVKWEQPVITGQWDEICRHGSFLHFRRMGWI